MLESGLIPPNINFKRGNPKIKFDKWNIQVPIEVTPWPTNGVRRISTNSFGYGGTNAHAILEDADYYLKNRRILANGSTKGSPTEQAINGTDEVVNGIHGSDDCKVPQLFVVSAQDRNGLKRVK